MYQDFENREESLWVAILYLLALGTDPHSGQFYVPTTSLLLSVYYLMPYKLFYSPNY